ncbi:Predicted nucleotidyltransferase [Pilibacter termitis]|uniref:tRNA(Met) cytidine acetate ligase n=1 Tax=Pilibacter termitis TaxID=263852 RepID=A0A1T4M6S9_9ENTE|nr:nucleotidyltransferase [Pilibacter termitis]SJZ62566.1 Predicted nucleotidyltransferase [Pilibacter termitis]
MQATGLITEYNPFHNGHLYHAKVARKLSGCDCVIAVMSGNFTQRGEVALVDKWSRATMALQSGAVDLIVELPPQWSVQSADYFAKGGVQLLSSLQCSSIVFGTDVKERVDYETFGRFAVEQEEVINQKVRDFPQKSASFPEKMTSIYQALLPEFTLDFSSPNHILAMGYARENAKLAQPMKLQPIQRVGASFHDTLVNGKIASATAIRLALAESGDISKAVPPATLQLLQEATMVSWENLFPFLRYKLLSTSAEELHAIYQMSEGLEYRLKEKIEQAQNFEDFLAKIATKRYTAGRLKRLLCYCLWNATEEEIRLAQSKTSLHVLGMNEIGQRYLKEKKESMTLPVISKISKREETTKFMVRVDSIFQLANPKIKEQSRGRFPVKV